MPIQDIFRFLWPFAWAAFVGGTVTFLGLDQAVARMMGAVASSSNLAAITLAIAGLAGAVALVAALVFRLDERFTDLISPRPALGSLPYKQFVCLVERQLGTQVASLEMILDLENHSDRFLRYSARLTATIDGTPFINGDGTNFIQFDGHVSGRKVATLILQMPNAPLQIKNNVASIADGSFRYDVTYFYEAKGRSRRTGKTIKFGTRFPAEEQPWTQRQTRLSVLFREEIEE